MDNLDRKRLEYEIQLAKQSAEKGFASGYLNLADMYATGNEFIEKDIDKAISFYDMALANIKGDCTDDISRAYTAKAWLYVSLWREDRHMGWIDKAISTLVSGVDSPSLPSVRAATTLGDLYSNHLADKDWPLHDYSKAVYYYKRAIDVDYKLRHTPAFAKFVDEACLNQAYDGLARIYWNGLGVPADKDKAFLYALKSLKECPQSHGIHAQLKEMFDTGIVGQISQNLSNACIRHDFYTLLDFIRIIEMQYGQL